MPYTQLRTRVAEVANPEGRHPIVLVCEHASAHIPPSFGDLGLSDEARQSHIAWDLGALPTAKALSSLLDAPLIHSTVSRLVYDLNRPPTALDAIPAQSEATLIPGNFDLDAAAREQRVATYYLPWERQLADLLDARSQPPVVVTIHSFTPTYLGRSREVEIGILHDRDTRLADAMLSLATVPGTARNQPYGPEDGVTHTLKTHALPQRRLNVMIEIRNDLIARPEDCAGTALRLQGWLEEALTLLPEASA